MVKSGKTSSGKKSSKKAARAKMTAKAKHTSLTKTSHAAGTHEMPQGYNIDTIVLMPVNMDTSFIYWELTDKLLNGNRKKLKAGSAQLMVKVFETDCLKEVCSFEVQDRVGSSYINYPSSLRPLFAEIGISNGNGFVPLLKTRSEASPSCDPAAHGEKSVSAHLPAEVNRSLVNAKCSTVSPGTNAEVWMTRSKEGVDITHFPGNESFLVTEKIINYYRDVSDSQETSFFK